MNGRHEYTLSLPVTFLISWPHSLVFSPLPVLASPHLFIHTPFSLRPCRHRSHSLSVSAITASCLPPPPAPPLLSFCIAFPPSPSWTHSPNTLTLLRASVGSTCIQTTPPALVECMQASIPILLLCVQIFSLRDLPFLSI